MILMNTGLARSARLQSTHQSKSSCPRTLYKRSTGCLKSDRTTRLSSSQPIFQLKLAVLMIISFMTIVDVSKHSVSAAPHDNIKSSGFLVGVGYREQELQQAKGEKFASEAVGVVNQASYAGGTNVFIKGSGLAVDPEANFVVMQSADFDDQKFLAPMLTLDDSFQSQTANGMLSYRLPALETLMGIPSSEFDHLDTMTFTVTIRTVSEIGFSDLACDRSTDCRVIYHRYYSAVISHIEPAVVYQKAVTQIYFNPQGIPDLLDDLLADELPIINAKLGLGRLDFEGYIDSKKRVNRYQLNEVAGQVQEQVIAKENGVHIQWETGASLVQPMAKTCSYDMTDCYHSRVLPVILEVSKSEGFVAGGQELTIKGQGFNYGTTAITIDGVACVEKSKTDYELVCVTGAASLVSTVADGTHYAGQNGLKADLYYVGKRGGNVPYTQSHIESNSIAKTNTTLRTSFEMPFRYADYYSTNTKAWFVPPTSTRYRFYMTCRHRCDLKLDATNANQIVPEGAVKIIDNVQETHYRDFYRNWYLDDLEQTRDLHYYHKHYRTTDSRVDQLYRSDWVSLTAGSQYYIETFARHWNGDDHATVGVEIEDSAGTVANHHHAMKSMQRLSIIPAEEVYEKTTIKIVGGNGGTFKVRFTNPVDGKTIFSRTLNENTSMWWFRHYLWVDYYSKVTRTNQHWPRVYRNYDKDTDTITFDIVHTHFLDGPSYSAISISKLSSKGTFTIIEPKDQTPAQTGSAPLTGKYKIKCFSSTGIQGMTEPINVVSQYWQVYNALVAVQDCQLKGKIEVVDTQRYPSIRSGIQMFIRFHQFHANFKQFEIIQDNDDPATQGSQAVTFSNEMLHQHGTNIMYESIPFEMIKTIETKPQVQMMVGDLPAACEAMNCDYAYIANVGDISSFSESSKTLTISGTNLPTDASAYVSIMYANAPCTTFTGVSASQVQCTIQGEMEAGDWKPHVKIGLGDIPVSASTASISGQFSAISPATDVNVLGDTELTITGTAFPRSMATAQSGISIQFTAPSGGTAETVGCAITGSSSTEIKCMTNAFNKANLGLVYTPAIVMNGKSFTDTNSATITLAASLNSAAGVAPTSASPVLKTQLRITLDGAFPTGNFATDDFTVKLVSKSDSTYFKNLKVVAVDSSSKHFDIMFGGAKSGSYQFVIEHSTLGKIDSTDIGDFKVESTVTGFTPSSGSVYGGTLITITGTNFGTVATDNPVQINLGEQGVDCYVETTSATQITCRVDQSTFAQNKLIKAKEDGQAAELIVFLKASEEAQCTSCAYTLLAHGASSATPKVATVAGEITSGDIIITVTGERFTSPTANQVELFVGPSKATTLTTTATEATFRVENLKKHSDLKDVLYLYFDSGIPENNAVIQGGVTVPHQFLSFDPTEGSPGGSLITGTIVGAGTEDDVDVRLMDAAGGEVCEYVEITQQYKVRCLLKPGVAAGNFLTSASQATCAASGGAECAYSIATTYPKITSAEGATTTSINIVGTDFITSSYTATVTYGGVAADSVVINSATSLTATFSMGVPLARVSEKPIVKFESTTQVDSKPQYIQVAKNEDSGFTNTLSVSQSSSGLECSFKGGCEYIITASGLAKTLIDKPTANYIEVCGRECPVKASASSSSAAVCELPEVSTIYSDNSLKIKEESNDLRAAKYFHSGDDTKEEMVPFDNDLTRAYKPTMKGGECHVGVEFKEFHVGLLSEVKYLYVSFADKSKIAGDVWFEGSQDGSSYEKLFQVSQNVREGWNSYTWDSSVDYPQYRFYRFRGKTVEACSFGEIKFKGWETIKSSEESYECPVSLTLDGEVRSDYSNTVTYKSTQTPMLTSISPRYGTVTGGTSVTFSGTGFTTTASDVEVVIDGVACPVDTATATSITCTTGSKSGLVLDPTLDINIKSKGKVSTGGLTFTYARFWSQASTWGGLFAPVDGESIAIQKGVNMVVDIPQSPKLQAVLVEGSLIFLPDEDANHHRTFDARYIFVKGGKMEVGTEEARYTSKITITLHGKITDPYLPIYGNKVLGVRFGILDMHGSERVPTWTVMDTTSEVGATSITLSEAVDWQVGESFAVASTSFSPREAEERVISSIDRSTADKPIISFETPLYFKHFAQIQTFGADTIDMRAEVGLLSRNVVIRGDPTDSIEDEYGATIFIHSAGDDSLTARMSYVEATNMGQASQLGRYAIHFHMIGAVHTSYLKGLSVNRSFNRAFTIHGNQFLRITDNFAYNVKGHTVFIEDGIETKNYIANNLIMMTKRSMSLLNTDSSPACFWITNPDNQFINNHAAGADRYGFWFDLQIHPTGPNANENYCPENDKLGEFRGNHAHSMGRYGLRIFHNHVPRQYPCKPIIWSRKKPEDPYYKNPLVTANYVDFTGWKCNRAGSIAGMIGDVRFIDHKVADNLEHNILIEKVDPQIKDNRGALINALIIGKSANTEKVLEAGRSKGFSAPRSENYIIKGAKFYHFDWGQSAALTDCSRCEHDAATDSGARTTKTRDLYFDATVTKKISYHFPYNGIWHDLDGTLTGLGPRSWAVPNYPHLLQKNCQQDLQTRDGIVCDNTAQVRRLAFHAGKPSNDFSGMHMKVVQYDDDQLPDGEAELEAYLLDKTKYSQFEYKNKQLPSKSWSLPYVTGHKYKVHWGHSGIDFEEMRLQVSEKYEADDKPIYMVHNFTDQRHEIQVNVNDELYENKTLPTAWNPDGDTTYYTGMNLVQNGTMDDPTAALETRELSEEEVLDEASVQGDKFIKYIITGKYTEKPWRQGVQPQHLRMTGTRCLWNCDSKAAVETPVVEKTDKLWSDASIWKEVGLNKAPGNGADFEIPPAWNLIIDVKKTPILGTLVVQGGLSFSKDIDVELRAKIIFVKGTLDIGTEAEPHPKKVTIHLHGKRNEDVIALDAAVEGGNKILANLGTIKMYGQKRGFKVTHLLDPVTKGGTKITVDKDLDIVAGDQLGLGTTSYKPDAVDVATVSAYNKATGEVTFTQGLDFYHWGAKESTADAYSGVEMRGEVIQLSRSIQIKGNNQDNWGCQVVTADTIEFTADDKELKRTGQTIMDSVELFQCSQIDTRKAAIRFQGTTTKPSIVKNSAIHSGLGIGAHILRSDNIILENNVFFKFRPIGIAVDFVNNIKIKNNYVGGIVERKTFKAAHLLDKRGGVIICGFEGNKQTCSAVSVTDNIVGGAYYAGFVAPGHDCGLYDETFKNNVAHSVNGVGAFIYPNENVATHKTCYEGSHFSAYKISRQSMFGFFVTDQFVMSHVNSIDCMLGISAKIEGGEKKRGLVKMNDINIYGETESPDCPPRAGFCFKEVNKFGFTSVLAAVGGSKPKLITSSSAYPHDVCHGDPSWNGKSEFNRVKFHNFRARTKAKGLQYAIGLDPDQPDYIMPQEFFNAEFIEVEDNALVYFYSPQPGWANLKDCGDFPCTGPLNTQVRFVDTKYEGEFKPIITLPDFYLIPHNPGFSPHQKLSCQRKLKYNGWICAAFSKIGVLMFESLDEDKFDRALQPVLVMQKDTKVRNKVNAFMDKCWDGFYSCQIRRSRFPAIVDANNEYHTVRFKGSPAQHYRFYLNSPDGGGMTIKIRYSNAKTYGMYDGEDNYIPMNDYDKAIKAPGEIKQTHCGENRYLAQKSTLEFYMPADCILQIKPRNVIQAMVRMKWDLDSFFNDGGTTTFADRMGGALGIPADQIKVVDVFEGSVGVKFTVDTPEDEETTIDDEDDEATKAEKEKLQKQKQADLQKQQTLLLSEQAASLDLGGELLDASIGPSDAATTVLKDGAVQITVTDFKNTLSCAQCIRAGNVFVYNHELKAPENPVEAVDLTVDPDEQAALDAEEAANSGDTTDSTDTTTDTTTTTDNEQEDPPKPYLYHDMADGDANMGWCCERAGGLDLICGERTISGKKKALVPDSYTPKSSDFASNDLALMACMQKTSNCGTRNNTIATAKDTVTLSGKGFTKDDTCSWIVKVECGLPKVSVGNLPSSMTDANTKITFVEWQLDMLENIKENQEAPHAKTIIPKKFNQASETVGTIPDVRFEDVTYTIEDVSAEIGKQNKLVKDYSKAIDNYKSAVSTYNDKADAVFGQLFIWNSYSWFDKLFSSEEDVVTTKLPSKPAVPSAPAPSEFPELVDLEFPFGGAGAPVSGDLDISIGMQGTTKYFGVFGQTAIAGDYGFTSIADESGKCKPKYVALNVNVIDDAGVSTSDEVSITVSVQEQLAAKELQYIEIPEAPSAELRTDPYSRYESLSSPAGSVYHQVSAILAVVMSAYLSA